VGLLRPVGETFMPAVLDNVHDLTLGHCTAFQLIGDQHATGGPRPSQQFEQQLFGRLVVAPAQDTDIEIKAALAPSPQAFSIVGLVCD
jgi:hypothetical protein